MFWTYVVYGDFKDLPWQIVSDKILRNKAFNIAKYTDNFEDKLMT